MILRAAYRTANDTTAEARFEDHEHDQYDDAHAAAKAATRPGEKMLYVMRVDNDPR